MRRLGRAKNSLEGRPVEVGLWWTRIATCNTLERFPVLAFWKVQEPGYQL